VTLPPAGSPRAGASRDRTWASALERRWYAGEAGFVTTLLRPVAALFGVAVALRRAAFRRGILRSTRMRAPVVIVGNVTVGGSGKTPLVAALVDALRVRGRRPGIVSRGYGRRTHDSRAVRAGDDARDVGDEPLLLTATGAPTWVGARRAAAAQALLRAHPDIDVVIADDGLQHYALSRDVEIAVIDATRALGNRRLLPAGPLREPASRLRTVDAIVWLQSDAGSGAARTSPANAVAGAQHVPQFAMAHVAGDWVNVRDSALQFDARLLADENTVAIAGIANPSRFFDALRARGYRGRTHPFPDHHAYVRDEVAFADAPAILMTEKDAVKCRAFADARMWMLPIRARVDPALVDLILEKIDGSEAPRNARLPGDQGPAHLRP
jgi:tetraacyldisaccharide 4'-kinase